LISAVVVPFASVAGAVSAYDDHISQVDQLQLYGKDNSFVTGICTLDLSTNWSSYITDDSKWWSGIDTGVRDSVQSAFTTAFNTGDYVVSNRLTGSFSNQTGSIIVQFSPDATSANWETYGVSMTSDNQYFVRINPYATNGSGECVGRVDSATGPSASSTLYFATPSPYNDAKLLNTSSYDGTSVFITHIANMNYPSGYAGLLPRTTYDGGKFWFSFRAQVNIQELKVLPNDTENPEGCFQYDARIYQGTGNNINDWTIVDSDLSNARDIEVAFSNLAYSDNYKLTVFTKNCPPPFTDTNYDEDNGLHQVQVYDIKIDGSSYILDTRNSDCSENSGFCSNPNALEDCTTYGIDLIGGFNCIMSNFIKILVGTVTKLLIPKASVVTNTLNDLTDFWTDKLGFLAYPFTFMIDFFGAIGGGGDSCTQHFPGNFFGADGISLTPCVTVSPGMEDLLRLIATTATVTGLVFGFHRKYQGIINK